MKKLIIWDFDGVIADTENLWVASRRVLLNQTFGLNWDYDTAYKHLGGRSDKDKKIALQKLGLDIPDEFWDNSVRDVLKKLAEGIFITPGIEDIFKMTNINQCIATGGTVNSTAFKLKHAGIEKYFPPEKVFTVDLVRYGKPEPDLFLLAAETMGYAPQECLVIEDSTAGLTAALRAKMTPAAFVKYDTPAYIEEIKKLGIDHIFDDMNEVKKFILQCFS